MKFFNRDKNNPYPINVFLEIFIRIWMHFFIKKHNISAKINNEVKYLDEPFLILSNHCGDYDPFLISYYMQRKVPNWVASDAVLRDKMGKVLKGLGAMPKKKGVKDTAIIREMNRVVQSGGAIGLFPEGARTWTGETLFIDPSLAKLIRLLNVPVVTVTMQGAFAVDPRWGSEKRKTDGVIFEFNLVYKKGEARKVEDAEIMRTIGKKLYFDFETFQTKNPVTIKSKKRAEYLDFLLYQCPQCKKKSGFSANGNKARCRNCNFTFSVNPHGFLTAPEIDKTPFTSLKYWVNWQNANLVKEIVAAYRQNSPDILLKSIQLKISYSDDGGSLRHIGTGFLELYFNRLCLTVNNQHHEFPLAEVETLSPQFNERLELMIAGGKSYRLEPLNVREAGVKWEVAMSLLFTLNEQKHKASPYYVKLINDFLPTTESA